MTDLDRKKYFEVMDGMISELWPLMDQIWKRNGSSIILDYLIKNKLTGKTLVEFVNFHKNYNNAIRAIQKKMSIKHGDVKETLRILGGN